MTAPEQVIHLELFQPLAKTVLARAQANADRANHREVTPFHVFLAIVELHHTTLKDAGIDVGAVLKAGDAETANTAKSDSLSYLSVSVTKGITKAEALAARDKKNVTVHHLFEAICEIAPEVAAKAKEHRITVEKLVAPPETPGARLVRFPSETSFLMQGRSELRVLARRARLAQGLAPERLLMERVTRLLDVIDEDTDVPDRFPKLRVDRSAPTALTLSRDGADGEIDIRWQNEPGADGEPAPDPALVMKISPGDAQPSTETFRWDDVSSAWLYVPDASVHFFIRFQKALLILYPELRP
jgi:hypothetical protein